MPTSIASRLSPIDLCIVAIYLVAITLFGLRFSRKSGKQERSLKSYFLANNTIPWWAIALSIVSAETSTLTIVSIPGVAFAGDMGFLQIVLGYMMGRIVVAVLFLPRYFRGEMLTAYQLIDQRFGTVLHKVTAGLFLLTRAAAEGVRVFAISIVVSIAIGTGDTLSIGIISLLTLVYTFEGGLAAVIWTDVVQMGLYVAGTVVALYTLGAHIPGGWSHIHAVAAPLGKFHVLNFAFNLTQSYTFWAGILGGTFLTMASHGTDQLMVQRMLAARNLRESRLALLSSGVVILLQFTLFLLIGIGLFVFYGAHPAVFRSNDYIFPSFIVHEMPHGVAGLLVAAILAAAMSNLSAALNSLASTTVIDFYLPIRTWLASGKAAREGDGSASEERDRTFVSRASTVFWAVVLFGIAVYSIQHGGKGHVVETGLSIASVAYGCLLGVFLLGTLTRYATQSGAIAGMICGLTLNLSIWQASLPRPFIPMHMIPNIAYTWYVILGAIATFAIGSLFSVILPKPRARNVALGLLVSLVWMCWRGEAQVAGPSSPVPVQRAPGSAADFSPVSALIVDAIAKKQLPGAVLVIGHDGQVVLRNAYGNRALEPAPEAMTEDTIFDMASLSKVLSTTTAILQLYEQKKIDLDAAVATYLPAFGQNGKKAITVRQLMTHYSGLPEDVSLKDDWGLASPDKAEGIRRAMASTPYGPAGVMFKYSDINFITLGYLVETLTGQTLDAYAREHVFGPLGMTSTAYHPFDKTCGPAIRTGAAISPGPKPVGRVGMVCAPGTWSPYGLDPRTAPTAHDDESKTMPAANPDFDHILRGTVHDPTTRRMGGVAGHAGVFSTAADTALFAQALLDKLLRNTGPFPLTQATLRLAISPNEPATAITTATIMTPEGQPTKGVASRGLGWDLNTAFSRPRGETFPITTREHAGSFGHTGFTGTSLWIDPTSDTYVILLANAIHPRGAPPISGLRGLVATAAANALGIGRAHSGPSTWTAATMTGIDVLEATQFAALKTIAGRHGGRLKLGLLTNQSGIDAHSRRTIDVLLDADPSLELTTLFTPEHGLFAAQDTEHLASETDPATHLPIVSLYGPKPSDKRPSPAQLASLDAIVIDLQDLGVRFWTYETILGYFLEATACTGTEVIVLDRPNPNGGLQVGGPISDAGAETYVNYMPIPARNGMTFGELARYFRATHPCAHNTAGWTAANLTIIPMQHWTRDEFFTDTGLPWIPPSPNMRTQATAIVYPGVAFIEGTNVSVGRGTASPYENFGAGTPPTPKPCVAAKPCAPPTGPSKAWFKGADVAAYLMGRGIPGMRFTATTIAIAETQEHYPFAGQTIEAVHLTVTDRTVLDTSRLGLEILAALHHLYPEEFLLDRAKGIVVNAAALEALRRNQDPREIMAGWETGLAAFRTAREGYLLYR